jgi:hypothetical protein
MLAAFDRADCDRINHQPGFEAGLDREQTAEFAEHGSNLKSLNTQRANA